MELNSMGFVIIDLRADCMEEFPLLSHVIILFQTTAPRRNAEGFYIHGMTGTTFTFEDSIFLACPLVSLVMDSTDGKPFLCPFSPLVILESTKYGSLKHFSLEHYKSGLKKIPAQCLLWCAYMGTRKSVFRVVTLTSHHILCLLSEKQRTRRTEPSAGFGVGKRPSAPLFLKGLKDLRVMDGSQVSMRVEVTGEGFPLTNAIRATMSSAACKQPATRLLLVLRSLCLFWSLEFPQSSQTHDY